MCCILVTSALYIVAIDRAVSRRASTITTTTKVLLRVLLLPPLSQHLDQGKSTHSSFHASHSAEGLLAMYSAAVSIDKHLTGESHVGVCIQYIIGIFGVVRVHTL